MAIFLSTALIFQMGCASSTSSTSGGSKKKTNTVSPYDRDFEPVASDGDGEAVVYNNETEDELFRDAVAAYDRGLYTLSREKWTSLRENFPSSNYATFAELKIADTHYFSGDYPAAQIGYEEFLRLHPAYEAAAYVRFQIANSQRMQYQGPEHDQSPITSALKSYKKLEEEYPESEFILPARRFVDICRENLAQHEAIVAKFYQRQGAERASNSRIEKLSREYADSVAARSFSNPENPIDPSVETTVSESGAEPTDKGSPTILAAEAAWSASAASSGNSPATPELILKNSEPRTAEGSIRSRLTEDLNVLQAITEEDQLRNSNETTDSKIKNSPVDSMKCERMDALLIFTLALKKPFQMEESKTVESGKRHTVQTYLGDASSEIPTKNPEKNPKKKPIPNAVLRSCSVGSILAKVSVAQGNKDNTTDRLKFSLDMPSPALKYHLFQLDRPSRIVAVVETR